MENKNIITAEDQAPNTISASSSIFNVQALSQLTAFANLMADASIAIPDHLSGKPADCMAIVMQSMQWGMNPYGVAQKTFFVGGKIGYEAQLLSAILSSTGAITGRFHYEYDGDWSRCTRSQEVTKEKTGKNGKYNVTERVRAWSDQDENGLCVRCGAVLRGESEITWGEPVYLSGVVTRNSPLWSTNPKQQIAYLATKYWSRIYCPAAVLGFQDRDDLDARKEKVINPVPARHISLSDLPESVNTSKRAGTIGENVIESAAVKSLPDEFRQRILDAGTIEETTAIRADLEEHKSALGTDYTELKNKTVARHHQLNAVTSLHEAINALPAGGSPEAAVAFEAAERKLNAARRHLGEELHERFTITLNDLRPEYQG
ncbi:recombinase RecT [Pantoea sp. Bo_2]|uniref:RecT family recombinase n=1 Tax=unclassified Pantoea TaxID=2630326 RepID=UPI001231CF5B|nr:MULTISPECIES: RecT family recombinase [unclassified Pantoea]KAA5936432.1 recombinase RecT [Pantoea sp. VH_3]KAA5949704.1 recombinase RecT [Pantoea sp. VH_25]KAA5955430.1 recombinase RecT [Pantoea sp. VH_24]KAA5958949.1 recombinase RecT [Pantoea sp. VH_16]KAA5964147.1 recombinase RecT [Pantoea sp. VH_18]